MMKYLRLLKDGVRNLSYGNPYEGPTVQASDVVQWAVDEIARLRLNDAEREAIRTAADAYAVRGSADGRESVNAATLRGLLERTGGVE